MTNDTENSLQETYQSSILHGWVLEVSNTKAAPQQHPRCNWRISCFRPKAFHWRRKAGNEREKGSKRPKRQTMGVETWVSGPHSVIPREPPFELIK